LLTAADWDVGTTSLAASGREGTIREPERLLRNRTTVNMGSNNTQSVIHRYAIAESPIAISQSSMAISQSSIAIANRQLQSESSIRNQSFVNPQFGRQLSIDNSSIVNLQSSVVN
jgi:hypothetical protein